MPVELKDIKEAMKDAVDEGIKPLVTRLDALEADGKGTAAGLKALDEKIMTAATSADKLAKETVRFDATGKRWAWPDGAEGTKAPAFLRHAGGDSKPLMLSNIWRAALVSGGNAAAMGDLAPEELKLSDRLRAAGYQANNLSSFLFPLAEELLMEPVDAKGNKLADFSDLRKEVAERLHLRADPSEVAWLVKQHGDWAQRDLGFSRKDLQLGDDTLGGILVPSVQSDRVIDLLRGRLSVMRAGATEVPLPPAGNIAYPRLTSDPSFVWTDPDTTTDASTTNIGTGVVRLQAKSLRGFVTIPNDLLRYSSPAVEMVVRNALAARAAVAEDSAYLEAVGSSLQPKGVLNYPQSAAETPAVNKVTLHVAGTVGANGDTLTAEDVAKIRALYYMGNDPDPATAWIMRPLLWSAIRNRRADAITAGDAKGPFLFSTNRTLQEAVSVDVLDGIPVVQTVQASNNRIKGSGTTLVYILFGNFRRLIIGRVGTIELAVSEHIKFLQDKSVIRAVLRADTGLEQEASFVFTDTMLES